MIKNSPHIEQWNKCLQYLKDNLSTEQYNAWFAPISVVDFKDGALTLRVPSQFFIEQIEERYCPAWCCPLCERCMAANLRSYIIVWKLPQRKPWQWPTTTPLVMLKSACRPTSTIRRRKTILTLNPNPRYTFENYCGSMSNKLAALVWRLPQTLNVRRSTRCLCLALLVWEKHTSFRLLVSKWRKIIHACACFMSLRVFLRTNTLLQ